MQSSDNVDALSLDIWGANCVLQPLHLVLPIFLGGGTAFVKPGKGCPKVGPPRTAKILYFIQCNHLTTLMHSCWTSGGQMCG